MPGPVMLLGPQRPAPNLPHALRTIDRSGDMVVITAGWRFDEADDGTLRQDIGPRSTALPLYRWFDELTQRDDALREAYRLRQNELTAIKELYRLRLRALLRIVRELIERRAGSEDIVDPELEHAIDQVRQLDRWWLERSALIHARFRDEVAPSEHPGVREHRDFVAQAIAGARAVLIAGGHVAVLRNRMEFFGVDDLLHQAHIDGVPLVAWSAGAMTLARRIVVFHDDPPQGQGDVEVLEPGLGLIPPVTLFPHASERLHLDDRARMSILSNRFAPSPCITLENGAWLEWDRSGWFNRGAEGTAMTFDHAGNAAPLRGADA